MTTHFPKTLALIFWDPSPVFFTIPLINHPVRWYGVFFALGFVLSYFFLIYLLKKTLNRPGESSQEKNQQARALIDQLVWYAILGTLIGARLGEVFFYDYSYYLAHPLSIFKIWEGGLASHGGVIGIVVALFLYYQRVKKELPGLTFVGFLDLMAVTSPIAAFFIRIGNFFNQEILGTPSDVPWAVVFGHPFERVEIAPRHPVQLYEAFAYAAIFIILFTVWSRFHLKLAQGRILGLLFTLLFTCRFILEFFKEDQGGLFDHSLQTGQVLSIPFILIGLYLLFRKGDQKEKKINPQAST